MGEQDIYVEVWLYYISIGSYYHYLFKLNKKKLINWKSEKSEMHWWRLRCFVSSKVPEHAIVTSGPKLYVRSYYIDVSLRKTIYENFRMYVETVIYIKHI